MVNELPWARITRKLLKCFPEVAFGTDLQSFYELLREDSVGSLGAGL